MDDRRIAIINIDLDCVFILLTVDCLIFISVLMPKKSTERRMRFLVRILSQIQRNSELGSRGDHWGGSPEATLVGD